MDPIKQFNLDVKQNIEALGKDTKLNELSMNWIEQTSPYKYTYNFSWMGIPIIQFPQDMLAMQEIIWEIKPDLIIETGVAHGGSLVYYASLLELIGGPGEVVGIDIDIRKHNRERLERHSMMNRIRLIEGSSTDKEVVRQIQGLTLGKRKVLVCLDSNHTHEHVLSEMQLYSPFVSEGSYLVVFDTVVEDMPDDLHRDRPWGKGNNPKTAVREFLGGNNEFVVDRDIDHKLLITVAPEGYLKRIKGA